MELANAIEIIRSLADGRDPATGRPFPPDSPYQRTDTVRALFTALEALERPGSLRHIARVQHKVRLYGIDAPELKQAFGERAKQALSRLAVGRVRAAPARPEATAKFILTPSPRCAYDLPHENAASVRSQRSGARAAQKAISYQFAGTRLTAADRKGNILALR